MCCTSSLITSTNKVARHISIDSKSEVFCAATLCRRQDVRSLSWSVGRADL